MGQSPSVSSYQVALILGLILVTLVSLIRPVYPRDQFLHHIPTLVVVVTLLLSTRWFPLSYMSVTLLVVFLALHVLGARWVYSFVPYDAWAEALTGSDITERYGMARNHYDRFVHLCFGLLITPAVFEMLVRWAKVSRTWGLALSLAVILAASVVYELAEWGLAVAVAAEWADRYLGQQGDIWDGQKDMALAGIGAAVSIGVMAATGWGNRTRFES